MSLGTSVVDRCVDMHLMGIYVIDVYLIGVHLLQTCILQAYTP